MGVSVFCLLGMRNTCFWSICRLGGVLGRMLSTICVIWEIVFGVVCCNLLTFGGL